MQGAGGNGTDSIFFSPWLKHWEYCRKQRCYLHHLFQDFMDVLFSNTFHGMVPPVPVFSPSAFDHSLLNDILYSLSDHDRMGTFYNVQITNVTNAVGPPRSAHYLSGEGISGPFLGSLKVMTTAMATTTSQINDLIG